MTESTPEFTAGPPDARRAEAERAWEEYDAEQGHDGIRAPHPSFLAGYHAGDAAGYARAIAYIEKLRFDFTARPGEYSLMAGIIVEQMKQRERADEQ